MQFEQSMLQTTFESKLQRIKNILDQNPHPNIATIEKIVLQQNQEAFGQYKECHQTLNQYLQTRNVQQLTNMEIINILNQIIQGYMHLSKFDIVHRDLCLDSIFVEQYHDHIFVIKIATLELSSIGKKRLTSSAGRPLFQAPEIFYPQEEYDNKCDIYSLGIILFYLCYQQNYPIQQLTKQNLLEFHQQLYTNQYVFPQNFEINDELKDLLKQMIVYNPKNRISWNELYQHQATKASYFIINAKFYIRLWKEEENNTDQFQIYDLVKKDYCSKRQNYSIGSVLNSLLQLDFITYKNQRLKSINDLKMILENLQQQQIFIRNVYKIDDDLINVLNQIQLYLAHENLNLTKIQQELQVYQKIKIISIQPDLPKIVNQQQIKQNQDEDVFALQIGGKKVEKIDLQTTQLNKNQAQNLQFQPSLTSSQNMKPVTLPNSQQISVGNQQISSFQNQNLQQQPFPRNQTFSQPAQQKQDSFPIQNNNRQTNFVQNFQNSPDANKINQQVQFENSFQQQFNEQKPKTNFALNNNQIQSNNLGQNFQNTNNQVQSNNFGQNFPNTCNQVNSGQNFQNTNNQVQSNSFGQSFQTHKFGFDKQQIKPPAQFQSKSDMIGKSNFEQSQQQGSLVQFQSQEQKQNNLFVPQIPTQNFGFQNQVQQANFQNNQKTNQIAQANSFTQSNAEKITQQNKFPAKQPSNFQQFPSKPVTDNPFGSSFRSTMIKPLTQQMKEYNDWFELTSNTITMLEQQSTLPQYQGIFVSLLFLKKHLIQKLEGNLQNSNNLDQQNNFKIEKFSSINNKNLNSTLTTLEKANDQLKKQIEIQKDFLKNQENNENLKSKLKQLFSFQEEMHIRLNKDMF